MPLVLQEPRFLSPEQALLTTLIVKLAIMAVLATMLARFRQFRHILIFERRGLSDRLIFSAAIGLPLTAFISIRPIDPSQPDDSPDRLSSIPEIESCWSVAGDESYILKVRVGTPADLEALLSKIRTVANVATRTTIVLSTPFENRPIH